MVKKKKKKDNTLSFQESTLSIRKLGFGLKGTWVSHTHNTHTNAHTFYNSVATFINAIEYKQIWENDKTIWGSVWAFDFISEVVF